MFARKRVEGEVVYNDGEFAESGRECKPSRDSELVVLLLHPPCPLSGQRVAVIPMSRAGEPASSVRETVVY